MMLEMFINYGQYLIFNHVFIFKIKYSDVLFNISKHSYITQHDECLFDNDIVYTCICLGDWTKVS